MTEAWNLQLQGQVRSLKFDLERITWLLEPFLGEGMVKSKPLQRIIKEVCAIASHVERPVQLLDEKKKAGHNARSRSPVKGKEATRGRTKRRR